MENRKQTAVFQICFCCKFNSSFCHINSSLWVVILLFKVIDLGSTSIPFCSLIMVFSLSLKYGGIKQAQNPAEVQPCVDPRFFLFDANTYSIISTATSKIWSQFKMKIIWSGNQATLDKTAWSGSCCPSHHGVCKPRQMGPLSLSPSCPRNCDRLFCY